jgi:hypothetical protein
VQASARSGQDAATPAPLAEPSVLLVDEPDGKHSCEPAPLLDREGIEEAFRRLGDRLARRGVVADIYVFGGATMALAHDSRRAKPQALPGGVRVERFPCGSGARDQRGRAAARARACIFEPVGLEADERGSGRWITAWAPSDAIVSAYPADLPSAADREASHPDDDLSGGFARWSSPWFAAPQLAARIAGALCIRAEASLTLRLDQPGAAAAMNRDTHTLENLRIRLL